jgi:hypothetical protein
MASIYLCDQCGDEIKDIDRDVSVAQITVAKSIARAKPAQPSLIDFITPDYGGASSRQTEKFILCPECAMALLVALKTAKLLVTKRAERYGC